MSAHIQEFRIEHSVEWDSVVKSFGHYEVFYLSDYVRAFMEENKENGKPILLYYTNDADRAINVVFKRDIAESAHFDGKIEKGVFYDLISPYGYGGFFGGVSDYDALNALYTEYCLEKHYICEFVRFNLFSSYYAHYDGKIENRTHNVVRNLEAPVEEIWMDFKQKVRKNVKRANRNGLEIIIDKSGKYLEDFLRIYYSTMERNEAEGSFYFSRNFFETINRMIGNYIYFHVVYQGKIISTELVLYGADNCYSYLGGTDWNYFELRPNDFLKFEIIKWAKENHLKNFVLGGGYGSDDGIYRYKIALAPHGVVDYYIGKKIFDRFGYESLCKKRGIECVEDGFFPAYRRS